jgi:hypothetical protein
MKPDDAMGLLRSVRDVPVMDCEGRLCGVCDEIRFTGGPGEDLTIHSLLVGPGAWRSRAAGWLVWLIRHVAGDRATAVPWERVAHITSRIELDSRAAELGLRQVEDRLAKRFPRLPAL